MLKVVPPSLLNPSSFDVNLYVSGAMNKIGKKLQQLHEKFGQGHFHYGYPTGAVLSAELGKLSNFASVILAAKEPKFGSL